MKEITQILLDLGFEDREIKIYLLLLKEGNLSALEISRKTQIDRTTIYDILERMVSKGIISVFTSNNAKRFEAIKPEGILSSIKEKYSSLQKIIPELNKLALNSQEKVSCGLFSGNEGLKIVLRDLIESKKDYRVIGIQKTYEDILGFFNSNGVLKLDEINVKETAIVEKGSNFTKLKNGEYRYLDKKLLSPVTTLIYEDKVIFFIWVEPFYAVKVESKQLRESQEEYFNLLWKIAKP